MEKKISLKATAFIAGTSALVTFAVTTLWSFQICNDNVATLRKKAKSIEDMYVVDKYIDNYYYGEYDEETIIDNSLKAMVGALDDNYSAYMTPSEYEQNILDAKGSVSGIGITVNYTDKEEIKIVEVNEKGPAEEAGLKVGDIFVSIDGQTVADMEYSDAVNLVRGEVGTDVTLVIKRDEEEIEYTITRNNIVTTTVTSRMLENNIAYIKISGFKENTYSQYQMELEKCLESGAEAIIFDVRNNGGGLVSACSDCLDPLLPKGDIAIAEFKDGTQEVICKSDSDELDLPMAVLVNENSASAAELFSAALRDFKGSLLVGKNTFGKGIMQNTYNLDNGGGLRLTVAKYRTVKSECYHGVGLAPDYEVELPEKYAETAIEEIPENEDSQLKKAIEILKK